MKNVKIDKLVRRHRRQAVMDLAFFNACLLFIGAALALFP